MNYSTYTERTVNSKQRGRLNARTLLYASLMLALSGASVCLEAMDSKPLERAREGDKFSHRYNKSTEYDVNGVIYASSSHPGKNALGGIQRSASIGTAGSSPTPGLPRSLPCPALTAVSRPMFAGEAAAAPTPAIVATPVKVPAVPAHVWVPAVHLASWIFDPATIDDYNPAQAVSPALDYAHLKASQRGYFSSCDTTAAPGKGEGLLFGAIKAAAGSASALEKAKHYCVASIIVYAGMFALSAEKVFPSGEMIPFSMNCKAGEPLSSTTIRRDQIKARGALVHALSKSMDLARIVGVSSEPGVTQDSFRGDEKRALLEHVQLFFTGQKWNLREGSYSEKVHSEVIVDILQDESPDSIYYRLMEDAIIYRIFHLCNVLNGGGW